MQGSTTSHRLEWLLAAVAVLACAGAALAAAAQSEAKVKVAGGTSEATAPPTTPVPAAEPATEPPPEPAGFVAMRGVAVTERRTAVRLHPDPDTLGLSWLRPGIVLPMDGRQNDYVRVLTPCEVTGWVPIADVTFHEPAAEPPKSLGEATIVLDPGHGGLQTGAIGPGGLNEKDANLEITRRLVGQLPQPRVFLTRDSDFTAGLRYRTRIASGLAAHAFISIHNNAAPQGTSPVPGTETYHQAHSGASRLLAHLAWQEIFQALEPFKVEWASMLRAGTKFRLNSHGQDYYAVLRGSSAPAVIVEAMFISNAAEEDLLRREEGLEAVAAALARTIARFVTEVGPEVMQPYPATEAASGLPLHCVDPW